MPSLDAFNLSTLSTPQRDIVVSAVNRCTFDFTRCLPRLRAEKGRERIPVTFEDLSRYAEAMSSEDGHEHVHSHAEGSEYHVVIYRKRVLGLAYYSGRIVLEQSLVNEPQLAQEVFLAEAAHMVDFFVITDAQRRDIFDLFHGSDDIVGQGDTNEHGHGWFEETGNNDYWSWVGESWMSGFTQAYSDMTPWDSGFMHRLTEDQARGIIPIMDPPPPPPPPPPLLPPTDPAVSPYFTTKRSKLFHDKHGRIKRERTFETREEATAAGLKPCPTCRP